MDMWVKELAPLHFVDPEIFVGKDEDERKVCAFVLALALYFNDSKAIVGAIVKLIDDNPKFDRICEGLGEYSAVKNYYHRLLYAHIHELHYFLQQHLKEVSNIALFKAVVDGMDVEPKKNWLGLVSMSTDRNDRHAQWFADMRNGLGFHYVRQKELYSGYLEWKQSLGKGQASQHQEGAYISNGPSVKISRYYSADAAADFWMRKETAELGDYETALRGIMDRNANAVSGFLNQFITHRGGILKKSSYPKKG